MIIRDPLYNYIYLTGVEQKIVDNVLFQRLRHISQNGAAYYTYPSNHSCRFLHSLGTMEVAGRMVTSILNNSSGEALDYFYIACEDLIKGCSGSAAGAMAPIVGAEGYAVSEDSLSVYSHYGLEFSILKHETDRGSDELTETAMREYAWLVTFEAVRIAALLHDLGHFPYSHSLEDAFVEEDGENLAEISNAFARKHKKLEKVKALHERIGIGLLDVVLPEVNLNSFERVCRMAAKRILCSTGTGDGAAYLLHTIVASDLDADRLDYSMRDPRFSGMELGAFDLDRITSNIQIVEDGVWLRVVPSINALPAVESFYHQRYLVYKYLVYHHGTTRMNELVKRIVHDLALAYVNGRPESLVCLLRERRFSYLWDHCDDERYFNCTEDWLFSLMCDLRESRKELLLGCETSEERGAIEHLLLMIDTFVCRKSSNFITLTKRINLYDELVRRVEAELASVMPLQKGIVVEHIIDACSTQGSRVFDGTKKKHNLDVFVLETKPKTVFNRDNEVDAMLVCKDGSLARVTDYSTYLASLKDCVAGDQQFHLVLFGKDIKERVSNNSDRIEAIKHDLVVDLARAVAIQFE